MDDGRLLLAEPSCSNSRSSSTGDGGRMGSGFSGVFGRRFGEPTSVDRLPKLRRWERLVTLVESEPYSKLLSAEDERTDDRVSIDIL